MYKSPSPLPEDTRAKIAEAYGTVRHAAKTSKLPEYAQATTRDIEHVTLVITEFEKSAWFLRASLES